MNRQYGKPLFLLLSAVFTVCTTSAALGIDYSSTSFILRDPVVSVGGGYSSSSSFQYTSVLGQTVIGESTAASTIGRFGFLYFPSFITAPLVTPVAGVEEVVLSWTAASGTVAVDHYELGTGTISGSETYQNVGSVLTFTKTGLTGGTLYYFTVRAVDATGEVLLTSSEVSATPTATTTPPPSTPTGGGGGIIPSTVGDAALPAAPRAQFGEALDTETIRWYFFDRANNETGFQIRDSDANIRATTPPWVTEDSTYLDETSLAANVVAAGRRAYATNVAGVSAPSDVYAPVYTAIERPVALESILTDGVLYLRASSEGYSGGFSNMSSGRSGLLFEDETHGIASGWVKAETFAFASLPSGTYQFRVRARNGDGIETNTSASIAVVVPPYTPPVDAEKPIIEIVSPANGATITTDTLTITGRTKPGARVTLRYGNVETFTVAGSNGIFRFTLANLKNGTQLVRFMARAQNGAMSDSVSLTFVVALLDDEPEVPTVVTPEPPTEVPPGVIIPPRVPVELPGLPTLPRIEGLPENIVDGSKVVTGAIKAVRDFLNVEAPAAVAQLGSDVRSLASRVTRPTLAPVVALARSVAASVRARVALVAGEFRIGVRLVTRDAPRAFSSAFRTFAESTANISFFKSTQPPYLARLFFFARAETIRSIAQLRAFRGVFVQGLPTFGREVRQLIVAVSKRLPPEETSADPLIVMVMRTIREDVLVASTVARMVGSRAVVQVPVALSVAQTTVRSLSPAPYLRQAFEQGTQDFLAVISAALRAGDTARERLILLARALSPVPAVRQTVAQLRLDAVALADAFAVSTRSIVTDTRTTIGEYQTAAQALAAAVTLPDVVIDTEQFQTIIASYLTAGTEAITRTGTFFTTDVPNIARTFVGDVRVAIRPPSRESIIGSGPDSASPLVALVRPRPTEVPSALPVDSVVAKSNFGNVTLLAAEDTALRLPAGYSFKLFVRPSKPVTEITGELILTAAQGSTDVEDVPSNLFLRIPAAQAAVIAPVEALALSVATFPYRRTETGIYAAYASVPPLIGSYQLLTHLAYADGTERTIAREIETESSGYLYAITDRGQQERIRGAVVSLRVEREDQSGFVLWPGPLFDQKNPVKTDETGAYQFLPPPGTYQLRIEHPDYESYESEVISLEFTSPIARPIALTPKPRGFLEIISGAIRDSR
ncbi:MAG: fibronectin type III domain-containing protein [Patescibacteria group bacterium]